ncbi:MAG: phosphoethanolamine--lipid A transferase [Hydrogenophaga sp.]|uniref:phosphoethanolamine transferase n=1 Tax=Hydrogenophaga sp. TaxID=1904254 RepID=UPI001D932172|nr:phosphoethanolamine--lipid A transferase [Hydrogenophaga sp.]MBX3609883.1 phosphoethanolamine--lipid A transferase [Hydrogenophaga sp.]
MTTTAAHSQGWHPLAKDAVLAAWLVVAGNLPLWLTVSRLPEAAASPLMLPALALFLLCALLASFGLLMWRPWRRVLGAALIALAGMGSYFMWTYGIVIDPGMVANVFHTDAVEAAGLFTLPLVLAVVLGVALPVIWWWRAPVRTVRWTRQLWQRGLVVLLALLVAAGLLFATFQDLASLMRNNKSLRYMVNPYNSVYALVRQGVSESAHAAQPLQAIGLDARAAGTAMAADAAPVIVLVVGETARADNFGVGGYARDTTPRLSALSASGDITYFSQVHSCGTSTQVSVPCMFSRLGRAGLDGPREENVLDLLQRAGLAVAWIDNQSGCKGVCDRVPNERAMDAVGQGVCQGEACPDAVLPELALKRLATLDAQRRTLGSVIVLHQMGNHGPAYFERSQKSHKVFLPECETNTLSSCDEQRIVNAYDNGIRETDAMLGELIDRLAALQRPAAVLYVSDHGESLGENGLFLHGMPWSVAPEVQKHVPMVMWLSPAMQARLQVHNDCLRGLAAKPWSHDNLFHTLAGLAQVEGKDVNPAQDILAACASADSVARVGVRSPQ